MKTVFLTLLLISATLAPAATYLYPVQTPTNALLPAAVLAVDANGKAIAGPKYTNSNAASTIVSRDGSGNFTAGTITATLTGNVTGNLTGNATTATTATNVASATNFSGSLSGDVTGTQGATVVATVNSQTAAVISAGAVTANAGTNANTVSTLVKRDASGNFTAGTITATLTGNASSATVTEAQTNGTYSGGTFTGATNVSGLFSASTLAGATVSLLTNTDLTASRAIVSDSAQRITNSVTTATELGYVSGVTSAIQTQLGTKAPTASPTFTGIVTATNIANGLGLVATPSYTFTGDTDTGLWSSGANTVNFSTAGLERLRIDSSGRLAIGTTAAVQLMTINSDSALAAIAFQIGSSTKAFFGVSASADDPIAGMTSGDLGIRVQGTNDIFLSANGGSSGQFVLKNSGNVGIGTATPSSALHVVGAITTSTQTKTANYTLLTGDGGTTFADATAGAVTITLPAASSTTIGRSYQVFKVDSSGNAVNIAPNGSDTLIAGSTTNTTAQANCLRVIGYSSTAWIVNKTQ